MKKVTDLLTEDKDDGIFERYIVTNAPLLMGIFANAMVIFADIRAYDVVYHLTGIWWKALSASAACAIPFLLWEIAWQYNSTTDGWRTVSLVMAGLAFFTSIFLGVADFLQFDGVWANWLLGGVVIVTGIHTVVGLLYGYNDPDVARRRRKKQTQATMMDQELNAQVATQLLQSGSALLATISALEEKYDPDDVQQIMDMLKGKKKDKPTENKNVRQLTQTDKPQSPMLAYPSNILWNRGNNPSAYYDPNSEFALPCGHTAGATDDHNGHLLCNVCGADVTNHLVPVRSNGKTNP